MSKIELSDDGTMDTVLRCCECGEEFRGNYDPSPDMPSEEDSHGGYDVWVDEFIEEVEDEHVCAVEENPREKGDDDGQGIC